MAEIKKNLWHIGKFKTQAIKKCRSSKIKHKRKTEVWPRESKFSLHIYKVKSSGTKWNAVKWSSSLSVSHTLCLEGMYQKPIQKIMEKYVTTQRFILFIYFEFTYYKKKEGKGKKNSGPRLQVASGNFLNMVYVIFRKNISLKQIWHKVGFWQNAINNELPPSPSQFHSPPICAPNVNKFVLFGSP